MIDIRPSPFTFDTTSVFPSYLELQITDRDIEFGIIRDAKNCPVARAANRRFDGLHASVTYNEIKLFGSYGWVVYKPLEQNKYENFLHQFDLNGNRRSRSIVDIIKGRPGNFVVRPTTLSFTYSPLQSYIPRW